MRRQNYRPEIVVLVTDGYEIPSNVAQGFASLLEGVELVLLRNLRTKGVAGAWNTGLDYLTRSKFDGYVAILDDDDEWDGNHIEINVDAARSLNASVVISGLRLRRDGLLCERPLPKDFTEREFLSGNPGWQGSNTFISMRAFTAVAGFRDGMMSCNDRDLAIRLLRWPEVRSAYTDRWTATWNLSSARSTLSSPRSDAKLRGLRWFWQIYGPEMKPDVADRFFARARELFCFRRDEIVSQNGDRPLHCELRGDFRG